MKKLFIKYVLMCLFLAANVVATSSESFGANCLNIASSGSLNLGIIASGMSRYYTINPPTLRFAITSCEDCKVMVTKTDMRIEGFELETEWKMGEESGFEKEYSNGIIILTGKKSYYVTVVIKSIKSIGNTAGKYVFAPSVEAKIIQ